MAAGKGKAPADDLDTDSPGYKAPEKKSIQDIMKQDADDPALRKYKESLLGKAAGGAGAANDPRRVVILRLEVNPNGRPGGPICYDLDTPQKLAAMKAKPFVLKEESTYNMKVVFRVQNEIVCALRWVNAVYRSGIRVDKGEEVIGTYAPRQEPYEVVLGNKVPFEVPSGMLARGHYAAKSRFIDDDKACHAEYEYEFDIKKDW